MSWPADFAARYPWYVETAERVCTQRQLEVLQARAKHLTFHEIAESLGITRQAAHEIYRRAAIRVAQARDQEPAA